VIFAIFLVWRTHCLITPAFCTLFTRFPSPLPVLVLRCALRRFIVLRAPVAFSDWVRSFFSSVRAFLLVDTLTFSSFAFCFVCVTGLVACAGLFLFLLRRLFVYALFSVAHYSLRCFAHHFPGSCPVGFTLVRAIRCVPLLVSSFCVWFCYMPFYRTYSFCSVLLHTRFRFHL